MPETTTWVLTFYGPSDSFGALGKVLTGTCGEGSAKGIYYRLEHASETAGTDTDLPEVTVVLPAERIYFSEQALREMRDRFGAKPKKQLHVMPDGRKRAYWFYTLRDFANQWNVIQTKWRLGSFGDVQ